MNHASRVMLNPNRYIACSSLPKESIIVNRPVDLNFHSGHQVLFWGIVAALAGLVVVIILLLRIIAIQRRAEEKLRRAAAKYRIVADNTYDWEFWLNSDGQFLYVSPSCKRITGHDAEEFLADPDLQRRIIHPDDLPRFREHRHGTLGEMSPGELEFRIVRPDGSVRWFDHVCQPIFDDKGQFLGKRGSNRDITERKEAEKALRKSEEQYRTLFEGASDAIVTIRDGVFVNCNRKALELFRCSAEDFIGRSPAYFCPPLQSDGKDSEEHCAERIAAALGGTTQFFEWQHRRCDGTLFHAEVSLNRMEHQEEVELQAIIRDITERKAMERMKDEMISAVSHEMRTPLTAMLGFTEFLLEHEVDPLQQRQYLNIVHHETERLSELISNFLDLQRMKAQQTVYSFKPLAVRPLLVEAAALFAGASQKHRITVECPEDMPPISGDETRLHQVLNNLVSNAIKYSPGGGDIILGARQEEGAVTLWVKDEGIGIAPDALDKIFERFYRVDSTDHRATGGIGLGLALVRSCTWWAGLGGKQLGEGEHLLRIHADEISADAAESYDDHLAK